MSLDTLLEAAEYIEWSAHNKPRDDDGSPGGEIRSFIKTETLADGDSSLDDSIGSQRGYADDRRDKRRAGGAGTRETHNKLEKNRRAHLKECFDILKVQIPFMEDKKTSNLSILRGALKFIQNLKRKEKECERELHRLASDKAILRERIAKLKVDLAKLHMNVDLTQWMQNQEEETNSTSTASGDGSPIVSDIDDDREKRPTKKFKSSSKASEKSVLTVSKGTSPSVIQPNLSVAASTNKMSATPTLAAHIRAPVTQLLHQTLSKRQALQKQREQLAVSQVNTMNMGVQALPSTVNNLSTQQITSFPATVPKGKTHSSSMQTNLILTTAPAATVVPTIYNANQNPTSSVSSPKLGPVTSISGMSPMSGLSALGPISALTGMARSTPPSTVTNGPTDLSMCQTTTVKTNQFVTTIVTPSVTSLASMSAIKPILATPTPQIMSNQLTISPLLAQFPRTNPLIAGMTTQAGTNTQPQLVSLAQLGTVTPMTMMPQGLQMTGFGNIVSSQLLKQIPILQQPLLQQMQQGQVIGQPMVKPLVMVSLPSSVTTGPTSTSLPLSTTTAS